MSSLRLPDFPWDSLVEYRTKADAYSGGAVDLSIGTPVDPVSATVRKALASVSELPGYPATHGTDNLRAAVIEALARRHGVEGVSPESVLPTIGSKELVAWLPKLLGFGPGDTVAIPELAYPTYEVGALLAGAEVVRATGISALVDAERAGARLKMIWLNSPANPTGAVLSADQLREIVDWARARDIVVASDECYLDLGWDAKPISILHPSIHCGQLAGLLAVHSLSKSANLAGYRAGFVTGDPQLVSELLAVRKQAGMIVPRPVQEAMTAALQDDDSLLIQRGRYERRRSILRKTLVDNGFRVDHSEAGLYLWITRDEDSWATVAWFAERGIVVAPGTYYGPGGVNHVRVALTATDERVKEAVSRLA